MIVLSTLLILFHNLSCFAEVKKLLPAEIPLPGGWLPDSSPLHALNRFIGQMYGVSGV